MGHYQNWIHLDFKGMIPSEARLLQWLERSGSGAVNAIVLEYEDRYPWETFPGTFRKGYERTGWEKIWAQCEKLGMEVIPLIQTYGHLEWLLKHEEWARLRCDGNANLVCPEHPEIRPLIEAWIGEVARLHPAARYIHVGLDEVYHMGECPACQKRAECSPNGVAEVLLEHARFVCEAVVRQGKRPIVWGDMFQHCSEGVIGSLPPETVICEWKYSGGEGTDVSRLRSAGISTVMGASAIRSSYPTWSNLVGPLPARIGNITRWKELAASKGALSAVIHTTWARSRGLAAVYGPWEGWLPAFDAAADRPLSEVIKKGMALLQQGHDTGYHHLIEGAIAELKELHSSDSFEEQTLRWWELALRYYAEMYVLFYRVLGQEDLLASRAWQGKDPDLVTVTEQIREGLSVRLDALEADIHAWLTKNEWSDIEEYLDERIRGLRRVASRVPDIA